jgi:hypothetical protein
MSCCALGGMVVSDGGAGSIMSYLAYDPAKAFQRFVMQWRMLLSYFRIRFGKAAQPHDETT